MAGIALGFDHPRCGHEAPSAQPVTIFACWLISNAHASIPNPSNLPCEFLHHAARCRAGGDVAARLMSIRSAGLFFLPRTIMPCTRFVGDLPAPGSSGHARHAPIKQSFIPFAVFEVHAKVVEREVLSQLPLLELLL